MAKGVDVTLDGGRAFVSAETADGRRRALSALLRADRTGVRVRTDGPIPYWEASEDAARTAGLLDTPKRAGRKPAAKETDDAGREPARRGARTPHDGS